MNKAGMFLVSQSGMFLAGKEETSAKIIYGYRKAKSFSSEAFLTMESSVSNAGDLNLMLAGFVCFIILLILLAISMSRSRG